MRRSRAAVAAAFLVTALPVLAGEHRYDVGGFKLNLRCDGAGSPAVVFDAGVGDTLQTWDWVVPDLKKLTRVCAYDRAGFGKSDSGPAPRTSERIVAELHALLAQAKVPPPYVLVGHSFGGLNVRLYAATYSDQVAGLVLVDATPEEYPALAEGLRTPAQREKLRTLRSVAPKAFQDEMDAMAASVASVRAARPPPALPVVVIAAAHMNDSESFRTTWARLQSRLAGTFENVRRIDAARSDHYVQYDEPQVVVSAVKELVTSVRATPVGGPREKSGSP